MMIVTRHGVYKACNLPMVLHDPPHHPTPAAGRRGGAHAAGRRGAGGRSHAMPQPPAGPGGAGVAVL